MVVRIIERGITRSGYRDDMIDELGGGRDPGELASFTSRMTYQIAFTILAPLVIVTTASGGSAPSLSFKQ